MTLSDSDDVQTISSGSDDNKEREKVTPSEENSYYNLHNTDSGHCIFFNCSHLLGFFFLLLVSAAAVFNQV